MVGPRYGEGDVAGDVDTQVAWQGGGLMRWQRYVEGHGARGREGVR
jgi:hypothetical protein